MPCPMRSSMSSRLRLQVDQQQAVAGFGRTVGEHQVVGYRGRQPAGHQRCGAGHEAVHQNHAPLGGGLQHGAGHHGDLETAQGRQHVQRGRGLAVAGGGGEQLFQFVLQLGVVQPAAAAAGIGQRHTAQA